MATTTAPTEETSRFLQNRLRLMYRVGFVLSVVFLVGVVGIRGAFGTGIWHELTSISRWFHTAETVGAGALWALLAHRKLGYRALLVVDAAAILTLVALLNLNAGLFEIRTVSVFNLALTTGTALLLRAIVVPSTAARTFVLGVIASVFSIVVFFVSDLVPAWPVRQRAPADWPLPYQLISLLLWLVVLVAIATTASRVIFRLRREVREAHKLGQYVLADKLGEGGMGVVYRATHAMLRREAALKLLLPDRIDAVALRRFEREVVATARLRHPNTVAVFDYGRTPDGIFYYAMEYLDGLTVAQLVDRTGPLPPGRVVSLLAQVCASLEEAHAMGLVHRDIKPANVMVVGHTAAYDLVKVLDFGLVKTVSTGEPGAAMRSTTEATIAGTPLYMAPEAITHPDSVDARADLYAVAALGYFMLTGSHVFGGRTVMEICAAHLNATPAPMRERLGRDVAPDLEALLRRGLAKTPDERPPSAAAFREALLACDVAPWTPQDARDWWLAAAREPRPSAPSPPQDPAYAPTISVASER
ncbi:MAG: serine/threonine protein kinase [Deltaproteobacteria bacterium]|nr:serine/threonine protein kinase [Deltaproteobacteria bacterium]